MISTRTDEWLVVRIRDGDLVALSTLYERYKPRIYRTAFAIMHNEEAAEDILRETFLYTYTHVNCIDDTVSLDLWLYRVTINLAYRWIGRIKRWLHHPQHIFDRYAMSIQWHLDEKTKERKSQQVLQKAIDALSLDQCVVIVLYYLERLRLEDIAYIVGVPEGTIESRLYCACERLNKVILEQEHQFTPDMVYELT